MKGLEALFKGHGKLGRGFQQGCGIIRFSFERSSGGREEDAGEKAHWK